MHFYPAATFTKILQNCLKNLEASDEPDSPAITAVKRAVLARLAVLKAHKDRPELESSPPSACCLIARR